MQFTAKAFTQWLVLAALVFGAAWFGAQMAVKHYQPAPIHTFALIDDGTKPCPQC